MSGKMKLFSVEYYGSAVMDKRFSKPMLPWIIAEIKRRNTSEKICLGVQDGFVFAFNFDLNAGQDAIYRHELNLITRFSHSYESHCLFMYLLRDGEQGDTLSCHLYRAEEDGDVVELFTSMKEQSWKETSMAAPLNARTQSNAAQLTTLCADISPSSSHFFEVFYIGKIKVSHKKVPESFIDDALEKFKTHELEKEKQKNINPPPVGMIGKSTSSYTLSGSNSNGSISSNANANTVISKSQSNNSISNSSLAKSQSNSAINAGVTATAAAAGTVWPPAETGENGEVKPEIVDSIQGAPGVVLSLRRASQDLAEVSLSPMRERAMSTGSSGSVPSLSDHNRTMLFLVGRTDVRLISPDRKQVLLHKSLRDIAKCIQGVRHAEHFGFLCREPADGFVGFVFRCQSAGFADDVVAAVSQAFNSSAREPVTSCEHCPMMWYHRLCAEIEGKPDGRTQAVLCRRVELLPEDEQAMICGRLAGAEPTSVREQNELLMSLLRLHCEQKQARHSHDTAESRSEFLNQYLGGSGTIFMKAKRSLTSSFDQLLKRKGSRDDFGPIKELSLPGNSTFGKEQNASGSMGDVSDPPLQTSARTRKRSSTLGSLDGENIKREFSRQYASHPANGTMNSLGNCGSNTSLGKEKPTPMMDIFMKVGNQAKIASNEPASSDNSRQSGSWRQAIYNRVVTPTKNEVVTGPVIKRDKKELRSLWKKAINQQLILIRMEKENARLTARQEEATVKRIKLEYDEISSCMRQVSEVWELLISRESRVSAKCDTTMLLQAIKQGVPRSKRGDVWQFLAEQHCLKLGPIDVANFPSYATPYESLLKQLTSHQHGILIDLGRTFPQHAYFSSPLGPGQLALFNLLKAYSLLDPEVGYCQGLSFVAGVLLLHMAEAQAFFLLRHLMFRRGLRRQYLPDMGALQVQLYQLSRLLHDQLPEVVAHFNSHDVAPTLYAAPWLLTIFASQFPLGFVTRVFDLLFLFGPEVVFRVAVALLTEHKDGLLACAGFEDIMDYLKVTLPDINKPLLDRVMKQVFAMDVSRQLREYEVEYQVLQEESARPDPQQLEMLELENSQLVAQNSMLVQQLQASSGAVKKLEQTRVSQTAQIARLESSVRGLEVSVFALGSFLAQLADTRPDIELPGDVRRIVGQLEVAQRRQSQSKPSPGLPLRVINDTQDSYYVPEKTRSNAEATVRASDRRHPLKTALSSPNLSLKLQGFFQSNKPKRDAEDARTAKAERSGETKEGNDQQAVSGDEVKIHENVDLLPSPEVTLNRPPLKSSQSSFELGGNKCVSVGEGDSGHVTPISPMTPSAHPLSCSGVNFSYQGTTKLKSLRPSRGLGRSHESVRGSEGELVSIDEGKGETAR